VPYSRHHSAIAITLTKPYSWPCERELSSTKVRTEYAETCIIPNLRGLREPHKLFVFSSYLGRQVW